jgi:2-aminoadipate transaminase
MEPTAPSYSFNRNVIVQPVGRVKIMNPDSINLSYGFPESSLLPVEALNRAATEALVWKNADALHYTGGGGTGLVKAWVLNRLRKFGIEAEEDRYLAVYGANQGIELAARALINPGDTVWVEAAT